MDALQPALAEIKELREQSAALAALIQCAPSYEEELSDLEVAAREAQRLREHNYELRVQTARLEELRQQNCELKVRGGGGGL